MGIIALEPEIKEITAHAEATDYCKQVRDKIEACCALGAAWEHSLQELKEAFAEEICTIMTHDIPHLPEETVATMHVILAQLETVLERGICVSRYALFELHNSLATAERWNERQLRRVEREKVRAEHRSYRTSRPRSA